MEIMIVGGVFVRFAKVPASDSDVWFIHGYGGSGQIFQEAFSSVLTTGHNLYAPDIPGFGASPPAPDPLVIGAAARVIGDVIDTVSEGRPLAIVAHSLGGIIGTWLCARFCDRVTAFIDVEGNLTEADATFSGLAERFDSPESLSRALGGKVLAMLDAAGDSVSRHYASMLHADPGTLLSMGRSGTSATGEERSGKEFVDLTCKKRYFWAEASTPRRTKEFIARKGLPERRLVGCGHWPMIDDPSSFYGAVLEEL